MSTYNEPPVNPYDANSNDEDSFTRPLSEVIRQAILAENGRLHVWMPAMVVKVRGNQNVDLQPLLQTRYANGELANRPVVQNVPVCTPTGADYSIKLPIAVGDTGAALFCDRSLDNWTASEGGITDPADSRQHDLSDAMFIPGVVPFSKQTTDATTDMVLTNAKGMIRIMKSGKFKVTNGENEFIDLMDKVTTQCQKLAMKLSTDTVNTIFGPMQLNAFSDYQMIAMALQELITKIETLKG